MKQFKVGIIGATGYSGNVLIELLAQHSHINIQALCSTKLHEESVFKHLPKLLAFKDKLPEQFIKPAGLNLKELDCIFTATPNGIASGLAQEYINQGIRLIDLSADFRLRDTNTYKEWYQLEPATDHLLSQSVYGLSEWNRDEIKDAKILANPGCYPTASALAILPLIKEGLASSNGIIIDAKSGVSGAGKTLAENLLFGEIENSFTAYNILRHRHTPEIEQSLFLYAGIETKLKFTPHLIPMERGILSTIYIRPAQAGITEIKIQSILEKYYAGEQFVQVVRDIPKTKHVQGTNQCHIYGTYDTRSEQIVLISVIDNLVKGAAGQAVQNFNLMFGLDEGLGLS